MARRKLEEHILTNISTCLRKTTVKNVTKKDVMNKQFLNSLIFKNQAFKMLQNVRCSPPYWAERKKDIIAMISQLDRPTLFYTQSTNEYQNSELLSILFNIKNPHSKISPNEAVLMDYNIKRQLINNDTATIVQNLKNLWRNVRKNLQSSKGIFGNNYVLDYYYR